MAKPWEKYQDADSLGGRALGTARSFVEGATLGWGDEIGLFGAALFVKATEDTDQSLWEVFDEMQAGYRTEQDAFREQNPKTALAAEVAGAVGTGGGAASLATRTAPRAAAAASRVVPAIARIPAGGAAAGAIAGAGFSEEGERVEGAQRGALMGGIVGGATGLASAGLTRAANRIGSNQETRSARKLAEALRRDGLTPKQIGARLRRLGQDGTIADVGGANTKGLAETVAQQPGPGSQRAVMTLRGREMRGTRGAKNLRQAATEALPDQPEYFDALEDLVELRSRQAAPLYDQARRQSLAMTPRLEELSKRPSMRRALRQGERIAADEGITLSNSFQRYDYAKRAIDRMIRAAKRDPGRGDMKALNTLRRELLDEMDSQVPVYRQARAAYEAPSRAKELLEEGRGFLKQQPDELKKFVDDLTPEEQRYFTTGVYRGMLDMVDDFGMNRDPRLLLNKPSTVRRLRAAFGDDSGALRRFQRVLRNEGMKKSTRNQMLGNSATARRMSQAQDASIDPNMAAALVSSSPETAAAGVVRQIVSRLRRQGLSDADSAELGRMLFSTSPAEQTRALALLDAPSLALSPAASGGIVGFSGESAALATPR